MFLAHKTSTKILSSSTPTWEKERNQPLFKVADMLPLPFHILDKELAQNMAVWSSFCISPAVIKSQPEETEAHRCSDDNQCRESQL